MQSCIQGHAGNLCSQGLPYACLYVRHPEESSAGTHGIPVDKSTGFCCCYSSQCQQLPRAYLSAGWPQVVMITSVQKHDQTSGGCAEVACTNLAGHRICLHLEAREFSSCHMHYTYNKNQLLGSLLWQDLGQLHLAAEQAAHCLPQDAQHAKQKITKVRNYHPSVCC